MYYLAAKTVTHTHNQKHVLFGIRNSHTHITKNMYYLAAETGRCTGDSPAVLDTSAWRLRTAAAREACCSSVFYAEWPQSVRQNAIFLKTLLFKPALLSNKKSKTKKNQSIHNQKRENLVFILQTIS